ncbi:MAG: hypothetical protein WA738_08765 [Candidatus Angelobacter sp.]
MVRFILPLFLVIGCAIAQAQVDEPHLSEAGSAVVLAHSTFAHGYRHGYEEGYHAGNVDINMGRVAHAKTSELRGVKMNYAGHFGPRKVFEKGFQAGLNAGYSDGYAGRTFRAVDDLRAMADSLETSPSPIDPKHASFDQGFLSGYNDGFERAGSDQSPTGQIDFHIVGCTKLHPASPHELLDTGSYCDGYRRGFALGHGDGFWLRPPTSRMEASK